ncbi:MAG: EF-hand domain-containing protein [Pseudomonadota bacterium]
MKMQMTKTAVALLAAGFMATAIASENQFNKLDADADGYISAEEAAAHEGLQKGWQGTDANMDGKVDAAEFSAFEMKGEEKKAPEGK